MKSERQLPALAISVAALLAIWIISAVMYETMLTEESYVVCIEAGHEPHECAR